MDFDLFSEGKEYISASRAAKKIGYTSDYLGQLCRANKISGKLVGRTWYVDFASVLEHKKNQQITKLKSPRAVSEEITPKENASLVRSFKNLAVAYETEYAPRLPELIKPVAQPTSWIPKNIPLRAAVGTLSLIVALGTLFATTSSVAPSLARNLEQKVATLSAIGDDFFGTAAGAQVAAVSFFGALSDSVEFFIDGFKNLRTIAFGAPAPIVGNLTTSNKVAFVTEPAEVKTTNRAVTETTSALPASSFKSQLQSELEAYIRTQISAIAEPRIVYNTVNNSILRDEILIADTRPTVTRQSTSDADNLGRAIHMITEEGIFHNSRLTNATVSGPWASFTEFFAGNSTTTNATSTNFFATNGTFGNLTGTSVTLTNLNFSDATGTNATTTNFFATTASSTNLFATNASFTNLTGNNIDLSALLFGSATGTSATTTSFFSTKGTFDDLYVNNYQQNDGTFAIISSVPSGNVFSVTDNSVANGTLIHQILTANAGNGQTSRGQVIDLVDSTVAGGGYSALEINASGSGVGSGAKTLLSLNPGNTNGVVFDSAGAFRPITDIASNTNSIGSSSYYWKNGYFDTITANNLSGTVVSGSTSNNAWTIGSTEAADTYKALIFQRNSGSGNALFQWNAGAGDARYLSVNYPFNSTYTVDDSSISTTVNLYSGALTNNTTSGTQRLLSLTNTGTGTTENGLYINNTGTGTTGLEIAGTWTNGIFTNNNTINAGSGDISSTGTGSLGNLLVTGSSTLQNFTFVNATGTNATTTSLFSTTASSTNLFSTNANVGLAIFGNSTTTNATTTNFFSTDGNFTNLTSASQTLTDLLFTRATGTSATTTSFFSTTASSTNLFSTNAALGSATISSLTSGRVPFASTGGLLADSASFLWDNTLGRLTATNIVSTNSTSTNATTTSLYAGGQTVLAATSGNVGIGTTNPVAADGSSKTLQIGNTVAMQNVVGSQALYGNNVHYDGSWKYITSSEAAAMRIYSGDVVFHTGLSGPAGTTVSGWDSTGVKMIIKNGGNVGIGTNNPATILDINGVTTFRGNIIAGTDNTYDIGASGTTRPRSVYVGTSISLGTNPATTGVLRLPNNQSVYARNAANGADQALFNFNSSDQLIIEPTTTIFNATGARVGITSSTGIFTVGNGSYTAFNSGEIGLSNNKYYAALNAAGNNTLGLIKGNASDVVEIGGANTTGVQLNKNTSITGNLTVSGNSTTTNATTTNSYFSNTLTGPGSFTVNSSGDVGIGTSAPVSSLHVNKSNVGQTALLTLSNLNGATNDTADINFSLGGSTVTTARVSAIRTAAGAVTDLAFSSFDGVSLVERMRILSGGNVGIGTTAPAAKLDVVGGTRQLSGSPSTPASGKGLEMYYDSGSFAQGEGSYLISYDRTGSAYKPLNFDGSVVRLINSGATAVTVTGGSVGIGTTNPGAKLHVKNDADSSTYINIENPNGGTSARAGLIVSNAAGVDSTQGFVGVGGTAYTAVTGWQDSLVVNAGADLSGGLKLRSATGGLGLYADGSTATPNLFINTSGSVGIGTTNPASKLDISGGLILTTGTAASIATKGLQIRFDNTNNTGHISASHSGVANYPLYLGGDGFTGSALYIDAVGNVGINTASPVTYGSFAVRRAVTGIISGYGVSGSFSDAANATVNIVTGTGSLGGVFTDQNLVLGAGNAEKIRILSSNGNVGIGTTNPASKLDVNGGIRATLDATGANIGQIVTMKSDGTLTTDSTTLTWDSSNDLLSVNGLSIYSTGIRAAGSNNLSLGSANTFPSITVLGTTGAVGIGTTNPGYPLQVSAARSASTDMYALQATGSGATGDQINLLFRQNTGADASIYTLASISSVNESSGGASGALAFSTRTSGSTFTEKMRISSGGNLSVTALTSCGGIQTNGSGTMSCTSDQRLKDVQSSFTTGLDAIMGITPQTYSWKADSGLYDGGLLYSGFIAQNIQANIPEAVNTNAKGYLQVNTTSILAASINAIKELNTKVEAHYTELTNISVELQGQAARIGVLESKVANIEAQLGGISTSTASSTEGLAPGFLDGIWDALVSRLASAANGIGDFFANRVKTRELCIADDNGETCITKAALDALLAGVGQSGSVSGGGGDEGVIEEGDGGAEEGGEVVEGGSGGEEGGEVIPEEGTGGDVPTGGEEEPAP